MNQVTESPEWKEVKRMLERAHRITGIQMEKYPDGSVEQSLNLGKQNGISMALNYMREIPIRLNPKSEASLGSNPSQGSRCT